MRFSGRVVMSDSVSHRRSTLVISSNMLGRPYIGCEVTKPMVDVRDVGTFEYGYLLSCIFFRPKLSD